MCRRAVAGARSGQRGFTLLELVIAMSIVAILLPVLGRIFYQFARLPPDTEAALDLQNQLSQAGRWLNLDGTRAQSFVLGSMPEPPPTVFWVVDDGADQVFRYAENGGFLGTFALVAANDHPKGLTTDGKSIWVVDRGKRVVYRYNMGGQFKDSFALTTPSPHLEGITTDGTSLWVLDKDSGVFRYSVEGVSQNDSFTLHPQNSHAEGITIDGTSLWIVDEDVDKAFRYSMQGSLLGSFSVAPATHPEGVTTDGTYLWVVDKDTDEVYRFDLAGMLIDSFELALSGNSKAGGMERTPSWAIPPPPVLHLDYGTFGWHDYTVSPPVLFQVLYFFQDGELMREERIDGVVSSVITVASGVARFEDIAFRACPTFVAVTVNITTERLTDVIVQSQTFFLRLRPEPWGEITRQSLGYALFAASQGGSAVFQYSEDGSFLGTLPLVSGNDRRKGITADGTSFWVLDKEDKKVYRYDMSGAFQDSFGLTTPSDHLEGLTTDGTSIWVVDRVSGVFRYSVSGVYQNDSFTLADANSHPQGITTDGSTLWVVDEDADKVFHYSITGSLLASFSVAPATHPEGITTDGTSLWVVDKGTDKIYKFDLAGGLQGSFALKLPGNGKAGGLTRTSSGTLWVVDERDDDEEAIHWSGSDNLVVGNVHSNGDVSVSGSDKRVTDALTATGIISVGGHRNTFGSLQQGVPLRLMPINCAVEDFPIDTDLVQTIGSSVAPATHPEGITTDGNSIWVADKDTDKVYQFSLTGESLGSFSLQLPGNGKAGGLTRTSSGDLWVVDEESNQVFQYSEGGALLGTFSLMSTNRDSKGITTDGTSVWVLDEEDERVYRYDMGGVFQDSFALTTPSGHLEGITTDGTSIWIVDKDSGVFRYSLSGVYQNDSFTLTAENSHPEGITTDGTSLWVVDKDADWVFRYSMTGDHHPFGDPPVFYFSGDVNLVNEEEVWEDWPDRTRLKPGVYFATGRISLGRSRASGTVTFIADQIHVSGSEVDLWPFHAGIVAFGTGTGNDVVKVSGQHGLWRGMLYAPQGEVDVAGDGFTLYGSIVADTIKLTRQGTRILHNAY